MRNAIAVRSPYREENIRVRAVAHPRRAKGKPERGGRSQPRRRMTPVQEDVTAA